METYGVTVDLQYPLVKDEAFWQELQTVRRTAESDALEAIAACLRENTDDFTCIDRIIAILEPLGYAAVPRHDFG